MRNLTARILCAILLGMVAWGGSGCATGPSAKEKEEQRISEQEHRFSYAIGLTFSGREHEKALAQWRALYSSIKPGDRLAPQVVYWMAYVYDELGDRTKAVLHYREVVDKYPGSNHAKEARTKLAAIAGDKSTP
jgi:TolA-binding protein